MTEKQQILVKRIKCLNEIIKVLEQEKELMKEEYNNTIQELFNSIETETKGK